MYICNSQYRDTYGTTTTDYTGPSYNANCNYLLMDEDAIYSIYLQAIAI